MIASIPIPRVLSFGILPPILRPATLHLMKVLISLVVSCCLFFFFIHDFPELLDGPRELMASTTPQLAYSSAPGDAVISDPASLPPTLFAYKSPVPPESDSSTPKLTAYTVPEARPTSAESLSQREKLAQQEMRTEKDEKQHESANNPEPVQEELQASVKRVIETPRTGSRAVYPI